MTRAKKICVGLLIFAVSAVFVCCVALLYPVPVKAAVGLQDVADITGNGAAHAMGAAGIQARWVLVIANTANSASVRVGSSAVSSTRGAAIAPGAGLFMAPIPPDSGQPVTGNNYYDLSALYYFAANGDKFSLIWGW